MGRPRLKNRVYPRTLSFSYKDTDVFELADEARVDAQTIMEGIEEITERENTSRSNIIMKALAEYWDRHGAGNFQTVLGSYQPGGKRSAAQLEGEVMHHFEAQNQDVLFKDIVTKFKNDLEYSPQKAYRAADKLTRQLRSRGIKVWR